MYVGGRWVDAASHDFFESDDPYQGAPWALIPRGTAADVDAAVAAGADGLVIEATGAGNTSAALLAAAERGIDRGITVALTTRCPSGEATAGYAFPGGGATWVKAGAMLTGHLGGPKARVALALGIGAGLAREELAALLADPIPEAAPS
jgi:L-asparaginase/Glu-tRNA(Gln) amidotransferase subunit D